jgi:hypothetical protein
MSTVLLERLIGLFVQKFYQLSIPEKGLNRNHFSIFNDQNKKQVWSAGGRLVIVI